MYPDLRPKKNWKGPIDFQQLQVMENSECVYWIISEEKPGT